MSAAIRDDAHVKTACKLLPLTPFLYVDIWRGGFRTLKSQHLPVRQGSPTVGTGTNQQRNPEELPWELLCLCRSLWSDASWDRHMMAKRVRTRLVGLLAKLVRNISGFLSLLWVFLPLHMKHFAGEPGSLQKICKKKEKTDAPSGGGRYSITPTTPHTLISCTVDPFSSNGPSLSHFGTATFMLLCLQSPGSEQILELVFNPSNRKMTTRGNLSV